MRKHTDWVPYTLIMPAIILLIILYGYPFFLTLIQSFQEVRLFGGESTWVGWGNFRKIFTDSSYVKSLSITLRYAIFTVFLKIVIGFIFAMLLNSDIYCKKFVRFLFLLPWAMPQIAVGIVWKWILDGKYGYLNYFLQQINVISSNISWLARPDITLYVVGIVDAWMGWPLVTMMFLSGLENIPTSLYEAARVDGAGYWSRFVNITLAQMKSIILVTLTLVTIWTFNSFNVLYVMTEGGPLRSTETLMMRVYNESFRNFNFGISSALSVLILIFLVLITFNYIRNILKEQ